MSDTPETDALREAIDNGAATEAEMTSLAGKFEAERDQAREALRDLCNKIALRMMAENPDQERLDLIDSHKRAEALLSKELT